jgi:hypothetical protein
LAKAIEEALRQLHSQLAAAEHAGHAGRRAVGVRHGIVMRVHAAIGVGREGDGIDESPVDAPTHGQVRNKRQAWLAVVVTIGVDADAKRTRARVPAIEEEEGGRDVELARHVDEAGGVEADRGSISAIGNT